MISSRSVHYIAATTDWNRKHWSNSMLLPLRAKQFTWSRDNTIALSDSTGRSHHKMMANASRHLSRQSYCTSTIIDSRGTKSFRILFKVQWPHVFDSEERTDSLETHVFPCLWKSRITSMIELLFQNENVRWLGKVLRLITKGQENVVNIISFIVLDWNLYAARPALFGRDDRYVWHCRDYRSANRWCFREFHPSNDGRTRWPRAYRGGAV